MRGRRNVFFKLAFWGCVVTALYFSIRKFQNLMGISTTSPGYLVYGVITIEPISRRGMRACTWQCVVVSGCGHVRDF